MSNSETDQWDVKGAGQLSAIQFNNSEPHTSTTQWTINDVFGDDPLLKPVEFEVNPEGGSSSGASMSRTGP